MDKVHDIMSLLKASLQLEFPTSIFTQDEAVAGEPTLSMYATAGGVTAQLNAFIRVLQKSYSGFPNLNASAPYAGASKIQVAVENTATNTGITFIHAIDFAKLISRIKDLTVDIELFMSLTTVVPVIATLNDATKLVGTISSNQKVQNMGQ